MPAPRGTTLTSVAELRWEMDGQGDCKTLPRSPERVALCRYSRGRGSESAQELAIRARQLRATGAEPVHGRHPHCNRPAPASPAVAVECPPSQAPFGPHATSRSSPPKLPKPAKEPSSQASYRRISRCASSESRARLTG